MDAPVVTCDTPGILVKLSIRFVATLLNKFSRLIMLTGMGVFLVHIRQQQIIKINMMVMFLIPSLMKKLLADMLA